MEHDGWTDVEIVCALHAGDRQGLDVLVERFYRPLLNVVVGYVNDLDAAEDVLQELFIGVWERRTTFHVSTTLRVYLYAAARKAALKATIRDTTRGRYEAASIDQRSYGDALVPLGSERIEEAELARKVAAAVAALSERSREVYLLGVRHGLTYREIAAMLGISISTAQTHMTRALKSLEAALRPFLVLAALLSR